MFKNSHNKIMIKNIIEKPNFPIFINRFNAVISSKMFNLLMSNVDSFLFVRCVSKPYCKLNKVLGTL